MFAFILILTAEWAKVQYPPGFLSLNISCRPLLAERCAHWKRDENVCTLFVHIYGGAISVCMCSLFSCVCTPPPPPLCRLSRGNMRNNISCPWLHPEQPLREQTSAHPMHRNHLNIALLPACLWCVCTPNPRAQASTLIYEARARFCHIIQCAARSWSRTSHTGARWPECRKISAGVEMKKYVHAGVMYSSRPRVLPHDIFGEYGCAPMLWICWRHC